MRMVSGSAYHLLAVAAKTWPRSSALASKKSLPKTKTMPTEARSISETMAARWARASMFRMKFTKRFMG